MDYRKLGRRLLAPLRSNRAGSAQIQTRPNTYVNFKTTTLGVQLEPANQIAHFIRSHIC